MLVVVAHPDDEVLWFAGAILRAVEPVTVLCCGMSSKHPTTDSLERSCAALGVAKWACSPSVGEISLEWLASQPLEDNLIATHNYVGEYGHAEHIAVHRHVMERARGLVLVPGRNLCERYAIELSDEHASRKLAALMAYDVLYKHNTDAKPDKPKWQLLLDWYYGGQVSALRHETYSIISRA